MEFLHTFGYSQNNYGQNLNKIIEASPYEWIVIQDHDSMMVNPNWANIIIEAIKKYPDAGLFSCITNRIGNPQQRAGIDPDNHNIVFHRQKARELEEKGEVIEASRPISGILMVTSKTAWKKAGGFKENGIIGIDNNYHGKIKKAGLKAYILNNLYMYHWYRYKNDAPLVKKPMENKGAVICSYRIDGGGNQSGKKLAELLGYDFVNIHTGEWKNCRAKKQIWYMNDDIYRFNGKENEAFKKVLSYADDIKVVLNFVIGGTHNARWVLDYPVSKILFLNKQREGEWKEVTKGTRWGLIDTIALCPPIDVEQYENINRQKSEYLRIGRHSRISLKYPDNMCDLYHAINKPNREFHFMLAHPKIKQEFTQSNFKYYEWNQVPVKQYLENLDIWLCIINPKTKEQGPRTLAEAMLAGCACITENRDGPTDKIINGETGFLVNSEGEISGILDLLENDRELLSNIGENARRYALKNFHYDKWIKELK